MSERAYTFQPSVDPNALMRDLVLGMGIVELTAANVATEAPATDLLTRLPFVIVNHWGGDAGRFDSNPIIDVSYLSTRYATSRDGARLIEARLLGYPLRVSSGGRSVLVDRVEVVSPTVEIEWAKDSDIRRFQGTYQLSIRR
jgi:hypothetical protein